MRPEIRKKGNKRGKTALLKICPSLSIYDVKGLQTDLLKRLEKNEFLEIDVSGITECDATGLQLLYSTGMTAFDMGGRLVISGESEVLGQVLQRTGLTLEMIVHRKKGQEVESDNPRHE